MENNKLDVIDWLNDMANDDDWLSYYSDSEIRLLAKDALELLKAQEAPDTNVGEWTTERTQEHDGEWYCSECGYEPVVMSDDMKYCPGCGRKMSLPEPPKEG